MRNIRQECEQETSEERLLNTISVLNIYSPPTNENTWSIKQPHGITEIFTLISTSDSTCHIHREIQDFSTKIIDGKAHYENGDICLILIDGSSIPVSRRRKTLILEKVRSTFRFR